MPSLHDRLINLIKQRLELSPLEYDSIGVKEEYGPRWSPTGEVDLYAIKGDTLLIFEIKSRDTHRAGIKATNQLDRATECCRKFIYMRRKYKFYCYWEDYSTRSYGVERILG